MSRTVFTIKVDYPGAGATLVNKALLEEYDNAVWALEDIATGTVGFPAAFLPVTDATYDIGSALKQWKNLYVAGVANLMSSVIVQTSTTGEALDVGRNLPSGSTDSPVVYIHNDNSGDNQSCLYVVDESSNLNAHAIYAIKNGEEGAAGAFHSRGIDTALAITQQVGAGRVKTQATFKVRSFTPIGEDSGWCGYFQNEGDPVHRSNNNGCLLVENWGFGHAMYVEQRGKNYNDATTTYHNKSVAQFDQFGTGNGLAIIYRNDDGGGIMEDGNSALYAYSNQTQVSTNGFFRLYLANGSATQNLAELENDGLGNGIFLNQDGNGVALNIDSEATSVRGIYLLHEGVSASAFTIQGNGVRGAGTPMFELVSNAIQTNDSSIQVIYSGKADTNGEILRLQRASATSTAGVLQILNTGSGYDIQAPNFSLTNGVITSAGDITDYENTNDGSPEFRLGSADAEELHIQSVYDTGAKTIDHVLFQTDVASATADKGQFKFNVDGTEIMRVDDGGIEVVGTVMATLGIMPDVDDGAYLGQSGTAFSDLFLASGAVINFAAGNATITHSAGILTFNVFPVTPSSAPDADYEVANKKYVDDTVAGKDTLAEILAVGNITGANDIVVSAGQTIKSAGVNGNTMILAANDTTFITFTTGATDTCDLAAGVTIGTAYIYRAGGTDIAVADGGTGVSNAANNTITFTGNYTLGLTLTNNTSVTLPVAGTLATLAGAEALTNKTIGTTNLISFNSPQGFLINGKIVPSVANNDLTVAIKGIDGNDPSATNPVYCRIGDTVRLITAALSITLADGTNYFNSGAVETAAKEIDYFVYLGYNATDGVVLGFSRIPYGTLYSSFSATNTNDKYCAISTITHAAAGDNYENIGRFAATLSATANFYWSVPTFTTTNLIQRPIYETREMVWLPAVTASGSMGVSITGNYYNTYQISGNRMFFKFYDAVTTSGSASNYIYITTPLSRDNAINGLDIFSACDGIVIALAGFNGTSVNQLAFFLSAYPNFSIGAQYINISGWTFV